MRVALSQISPKLSKDNFDIHIEEINTAKEKGAKVIIFPELSMNGYMLMDAVYEDFFVESDFDIFKELSKEIDIVIGAVTKKSHKIYNSALYFSDGEILATHHKNNLPNYGMFQEARFFFKGDGCQYFDTEFGKSMMVVCEDLWSSKVIDTISSNRPDILFVIANSPSRDFSDDGVLSIEKKWLRILSTTAILSGAFVIFVNRVGFEDGMGFWGGSMVVNPNGKVEKRAELFERELLIYDLFYNISNIQKYLLRGD